MKKAIILSISADIGISMAQRWLDAGVAVAGTYRTANDATKNLENQNARLFHCDLANSHSVDEASIALAERFGEWDTLVLAAGSQDPVGPFADTDFDKWAESIQVNFTNQLRFVHKLLPYRNKNSLNGPSVLFFAGGGTNNAVVNYSAYTIAKIGLIKICELLDAEIPDTRFAIVGPGWVKTKIHDSTIKAGERWAGANFKKTLEKLESDECTSMDQVLDCFDWLVAQPRSTISGRNFSVVFDAWGTPGFSDELKSDPNLFKLRRFGNDRPNLKRR